jgi:hypothetical protein
VLWILGWEAAARECDEQLHSQARAATQCFPSSVCYTKRYLALGRFPKGEISRFGEQSDYIFLQSWPIFLSVPTAN